jgi:hypothetical protein
LPKALLQQQRNQRARCGDAEAYAGKNDAADNASLARRGMWQQPRWLTFVFDIDIG